jgi:DNA-directed RNA polymerase subunit RPC12/RpoP
MPTFRFYCVVCGTSLHASVDSQDDVIECRSCSRYVPIPRLAKLPGRFTGCLPAFPPDILELSVKFLCTACGRRLRVDARWEGRTVVCPACSGKTAVPRWSTVTDWPRSPESSRDKPVPATRAPVDSDKATLSTEEIDFLRGPGTKNSGAAA